MRTSTAIGLALMAGASAPAVAVAQTTTTSVPLLQSCATSSTGERICVSGSFTVTTTPPTAPSPPPPPPPPNQSYTCVTNISVGPSGAQYTSIAAADASGKLTPGTCVNVAPGTYSSGPTTLSHGGNANSPTGYVVYRSTTKGAAHLVASGSIQNWIQVNAPYVVFDGFDFNGGNAGRTSGPVTSGACLTGQSHHFQALNNIAHDCGGAGIGALYSDFYWIIGNVVHDCAKFSGYQESGISIYEPAKAAFTATAVDTNATYHIQVTGNTTYANAETYVPGTGHTDGNGIILDDFLDAQGNNPNVPSGTVYPYKTLVQGNTSHDNGGRGVHVFSSTGVLVTANTVYNNVLDQSLLGQERGGLSVVNSTNTTITNNKASAPTSATGLLQYGTAAMDKRSSASTWSGNATFDPRNGQRSMNTDNAALSSSFPTNNPLGSSLP